MDNLQKLNYIQMAIQEVLDAELVQEIYQRDRLGQALECIEDLRPLFEPHLQKAFSSFSSFSDLIPPEDIVNFCPDERVHSNSQGLDNLTKARITQLSNLFNIIENSGR